MKKKKIIFSVINDLNYDQRMIRICKSLVKEGFNVTLIGRKLKKSKPLQDQLFQQIRLNCFFEKGKMFYLEYNIRLFFFLLRNNWDAICAIDLDTILPAFYVSKWKGKKMIYDAHEYFTEVPEVAKRTRVKAVWEWVAQHTIPRIQYCYTVGNSLATIFRERYGTHFEVIRNVPFASNFEQPISNNRAKKIILYQGALNEGRGLEEMIEAMTEIENAELWLLGEGDLSCFLRDKTKQLQIENDVKFLGFLFPNELKKITPKATIGINLLKNTSLNYYYSLANKTFDYVQAGIPAIHMKFPEYENIMKEYQVGILIDNLKKDTLIKSVNELLQDDDLYHLLHSNCIKAREEWNWDYEEKKLIQFYENVFS